MMDMTLRSISMSMPVVLPVPLYLSMVMYYHLLAPIFGTEKQRAYILSTLSAATMTIISIPFVWAYASEGLEGLYTMGGGGWTSVVGEVGVVFFGAYLFADLSLGYFRYPSQIGLLTGWVHHTVYIGLMIYCLSTRHSPIFLAAAIMELPTFDLAISNLFPKLRNDLRFLSSFFLIRILYNVVFLLDTLRPGSRAIMGGSWVPSIMLFSAGCLHVAWFRGGLMGYLKRRQALFCPSNIDPVKHVDEVVTDSVEPTADSAPSSPDETPLQTPRTPSITPFSLRDAYLPALPPLPKLGVPNLPPLPSLPSFSELNISNPFPNTRDLNFGFKDAVKHRWEDRRSTFEGMGMGLSLGGLRVRRRARKENGDGDGDIVDVTEVRVEEVTLEN